MSELFTTVIHRPYVFAFLAAYLVMAWRLWGWRRTIFWLISGYLIAWLSEYSSIHNGFPYGEYHYVYENLKGELLVAGVPFFDSLSYPFLIFAGYATADYVLRGTRDEGRKNETKDVASFVRATEGSGRPSSIVLGALLTMLLDVIIDPIATMGDKWFLGKIHYYSHPGFYFGVPLTNFGGWFLVPLAVIVVNALIWNRFPRSFGSRVPGPGSRQWLYPAFYASIALFNIAVTFWAGEWRLGCTSSTILGAILVSIFLTNDERRKCSIPAHR